MLSGLEIQRLQTTGDIIISPFNPKQINPNSYNVRLDNTLLQYDNPVLDMKQPNPFTEITIPEDGFVLQPGILYLGSTVELVQCSPNYQTAEKAYTFGVSGRSSIGRLGIYVHATAGFGDAGFSGRVTLELSCIQPVRIYPWVEIAQIYFYPIEGEVTGYHGKYQDNNSAQPSMMYKDFQ